METILYLVRHGETYENHNHIVQGILDTQLTPKGIVQADAVGAAIVFLFQSLNLNQQTNRFIQK